MSPAEKLAKAKKRPKPALQRAVKLVCKVKEQREALGLSQRDVAKAIGGNDATICQLEQGCDVTLTTALKLSVLFGVSVEFLWPKVLCLVLCLLFVGCEASTGAPMAAEAIPGGKTKLETTDLRRGVGDTWRLVVLTHDGRRYTLIQNYDQHVMGMCLLNTEQLGDQ